MFNFDKKFKKNTKFILAWLDKVGRGALAEPIVSPLVIFNEYVFNNINIIHKFLKIEFKWF